MLFSELNDSKMEAFPKSFTYAAEFNITVSFDNLVNLNQNILRRERYLQW